MGDAPPVAWRGTTLRDELEATHAAHARTRREQLEALPVGRAPTLEAVDPVTAIVQATPLPDPVAPVRCRGVPGWRCGRLVDPQMMRDVRGVDPAIVGPDATHVCDACEDWLFRTERVDRLTWARQRGAPVAWLAWLEAKLERTPDLPGVPAAVRARASRPPSRGPSDA